jgi:RimJ/RimL family protein N-acetyltransferase
MPFVAPKLIESARVCVRPVSESDLPSLLAINGDEEVVRFLGHAPWQVMADAEAWFARISKLQASRSALEFVITARETGSVIGRCGLFDFEEVDAHAALGYVLGRAHWRRGYMREALAVLIHSAFSEMGLRRLEARVEAQNTASATLLRRLGFTKEGVLRERWISKGETMDAEVYGLLRHEWSHFSGAAIAPASAGAVSVDASNNLQRRANLEDMPVIARIHRLAFFTAMPDMPVLHTPEEDVAFYSNVLFPKSEMWVAEQAGSITGFIAFRPGWVDHLYVHPDHQRRGIGRTLLALAQASADSVRLWTFQCNQGARRFYERHGFCIERETDGANNEECQPDVLYLWERKGEGMPEPK